MERNILSSKENDTSQEIQLKYGSQAS